MAEAKHTHKYKRVRMTKKWIVFKCALPNCPHFVTGKLVIGRKCICWRCGMEFIMTEFTMGLAKPHCKECTGIREHSVDAFKELLELEKE